MMPNKITFKHVILFGCLTGLLQSALKWLCYYAPKLEPDFFVFEEDIVKLRPEKYGARQR